MLESDLNRVKDIVTHCREKVKCLVKRLEEWASTEEPIGRLTCTDDTALGVAENKYFRSLMEDLSCQFFLCQHLFIALLLRQVGHHHAHRTRHIRVLKGTYGK